MHSFFFSALRGEAALKARLPKEARKNAAISPYDKGMAETNPGAAFVSQMDQEHDSLCVGELFQLTRKGNFTKIRFVLFPSRTRNFHAKFQTNLFVGIHRSFTMEACLCIHQQEFPGRS